jgi:hypothetical protein
VENQISLICSRLGFPGQTLMKNRANTSHNRRHGDQEDQTKNKLIHLE